VTTSALQRGATNGGSTLATVGRGIALVCLAVVVLEVAVSFLPDDVFLSYFTVRRLILLVGLVALATVLVLRPEERRSLPRQALILAIPIGLLLISYLASAFINRSPLGFSSVRLLVEEILVLVLVVLLVRDRRDAGRVLLILFVAVAAVAFESIRQFTAGENTNYFIVNRDGWTTIEVLRAPEDGFVRVVGYFNNPNVLGAWLMLVLPFAAAFAWRARLSGWVTGVVVVAGAVALILTFSRAPLLSIVLALILIASLWRWKLALLLIPVVAAVILNPFSLGRLTTGLSRLDALGIGLRGVAENPLVGVGPGGFRDFALSRGAEFWNAHDSFLNVAAEVGIVGGLSLLAMVVLAIVWSLRLRTTLPGDPLVSALIVAFVSFALVSLLDAPYNTVAGSYMLWLLLGLLIASCGFAAAERKSQAPADGRIRALTGEAPGQVVKSEWWQVPER